MGTRSRIAVQRGDHFESIYCHWDGYLGHVGKTLIGHYTDPAKVDALLALGDCSSLGKRVRPDAGEAHSFDKHADGVTVAYRDRGENDCPAQRSADLDALFKLADECGTEYVYVFQDGAWLFSCHGEFRAFGMGPAEGSPWQSLQVVDVVALKGEES